MPNIGTEQTSSTPVTQPSSNDEVAQLRASLAEANKELEKAKRSYDGLDGNFKAVKGERDTLDAQLNEFRKTTETEQRSIVTERDALRTQAEAATQELEQLKNSHNTVAGQFEAIQTLVNEFPDLVPAYSKKLIRIDGLQGEDLKSYLKTWQESASQLKLDATRTSNQGTSVPPPNQDMSTISLETASENKLKALRQSGPSSEDYRRWSKIEEDLIRQRRK